MNNYSIQIRLEGISQLVVLTCHDYGHVPYAYLDCHTVQCVN